MSLPKQVEKHTVHRRSDPSGGRFFSVCGWLCGQDQSPTHSPQENLSDFPAVNCTCAYNGNPALKIESATLIGWL